MTAANNTNAVLTAEAIAVTAATTIFGKPLIMNVYRSVIVEAIVATVLPATWRWCAEDWNAYDFVHDDGTRLECKQSAARQSWAAPPAISAPRFDIAARTGRYEGAAWHAVVGRNAEIYVFAYHPVSSDDADHRDPAQWQFYVVEEAKLPALKSIAIPAIARLSLPYRVSEISTAIEDARMRIKAAA